MGAVLIVRATSGLGEAELERQAALAAFRESEPAKTIPYAYEVVEFRAEAFELLSALRPERGPSPD